MNEEPLKKLTFEIECLECGEYKFNFLKESDRYYILLCPKCKKNSYVYIDKNGNIIMANEKKLEEAEKNFRENFFPNMLRQFVENYMETKEYKIIRKGIWIEVWWDYVDEDLDPYGHTEKFNLMEYIK